MAGQRGVERQGDGGADALGIDAVGATTGSDRGSQR